MATWDSFPQDGWGERLTILLHQMWKLKLIGIIAPLSFMPSWYVRGNLQVFTVFNK